MPNPETNPAFPTFPQRMADADVSAGLVLPDAAVSPALPFLK